VFADTLFGHVRGAFTGADQVRRGMIEEAADGTLLLDEIGDLSTASQVKLLRLLQEGEYFPLGSDRPKRLRARLMVATHHDVAARQAAGTFRRDLYYRLCTHLVRIPPLRERTGDLPLLVDHFLDEAAAALGKKRPTAPRQLIQLLATHSFPGNVRELRALVFNAVSLHSGGVLSTESFQQTFGRRDPAASAGGAPGVNPFEGLDTLPTFDDALELLLDEALRRSGGNQTVAARLLGVSQPALSKRLKARREHEES
jgi:DNA-binding NtrC family response regulator